MLLITYPGGEGLQGTTTGLLIIGMLWMVSGTMYSEGIQKEFVLIKELALEQQECLQIIEHVFRKNFT